MRCFFADGPALADNIRYASRFRLEPLTSIAAMAAVTERIGFIATASTTHYEPYNLARLFSFLDHISHGRVGWNIVTTSADQAAANFGLESHSVHAERYDKAHEFIDVVSKLWDSWEDGRVFAALHAEAIFTAHHTLASAQAFYRDIKGRVVSVGRNPDQVKILPGLSPFIGSTEAEAKALEDTFNALTQPAYSLQQLQRITGVDFSGYKLDTAVPLHLFNSSAEKAVSSRFQVVVEIVKREQPTIRQLLHRLAGARGHQVIAGTPEQVADHIQTWFEGGAADGFNIMPPYLTGGFDLFVDEVVPILRQRGLFRSDYQSSTLRGHYGLERPASQYSPPTRKSA